MRRYRRHKYNLKSLIISIIFVLGAGQFFAGNHSKDVIQHNDTKTNVAVQKDEQVNVNTFNDIPDFNNIPYVRLNNNIPEFTDEEKKVESLEEYGEHDSLNRCTACIALVGKETMPTSPRGSIGMVKPTGWHTIKYTGIDGKFLYNRCHLIGYQLTGENANTKNLITGTRYLNVEGMLPFENRVADYVNATNNHVLYRVTPIFKGNDLVARGVKMEAYSVEDNGKGVSFNVFCYNAQPGIEIDYSNGDSKPIE